jgi:D-arabinose 1-dehydrogenase-like Zn-dependent alcohol dehydrogenase
MFRWSLQPHAWQACGGDWEAEVRPCGYVDYMIAPAAGLTSFPDGLSAVEAAPLMCAGVTTFNALRHSGARPGDTVAVLELAGLAISASSSRRRWASRP